MRNKQIGMIKLLVGLLSGILLAASFVPAAEADHFEVTEGDVPAGYLYWEDGYLVMTYSAVEFCAGGPEPTVPGRIIERRNGTVLWKARTTVPVSVYEIPDIDPSRIDLVFAWLGENCDTEPYAQGEANLSTRFRFGTDGVLQTRNFVKGTLMGADGEDVDVRTLARLRLDAATGALIELEKLRVWLN